MKLKYNVEGLDCANCASKIEESVGKIDGIDSVRLSYITEVLKVTVSSDVNLKAIEEEIVNKGKKVEPSFKISKK